MGAEVAAVALAVATAVDALRLAVTTAVMAGANIEKRSSGRCISSGRWQDDYRMNVKRNNKALSKQASQKDGHRKNSYIEGSATGCTDRSKEGRKQVRTQVSTQTRTQARRKTGSQDASKQDRKAGQIEGRRTQGPTQCIARHVKRTHQVRKQEQEEAELV